MNTVIVTGAARGIGLAITQKMLAAGHFVAMLDIDTATLRASSDAIEPADARLAITCDVSDPPSVESSIQTVIDARGRIDALVNNAGIAAFSPFLETSYADWNDMLATNLHGPFLCAKACVPQMLKQGRGSIVNITSISGLRASTLRTAYGTSKAALAHLTKQLAAELGHRGIRVNAVAPGPVDTAMAKKVHSQAIRADYHDAIPLNRYGTEQEIASVVAFLCSEESSYVNGHEIAVDGGFGSTGIGLPTLRASE